MLRPTLEGLPALEPAMAALPPGYRLRTYRPGDDAAWAAIMNTGQMGTWDAGRTREQLTGLPYPQFDPNGLFFITYGPAETPVGSACAWLRDPAERETGILHMVCVLPQHRGQRLSYVLCLAVLHRLRARGFRRARLNTGDWRLGALKIYLELGFRPLIRHPQHPQQWDMIARTLGWTQPLDPILDESLSTAEVRDPRFYEAPPFWVSDYHAVNAYLDGLAGAAVSEIGRSYGGRSIRAAAYGSKEPITRTATYSSAVAASHPEDFFDPAQRTKPVLVICSSIHGAEMEGCVACVNLLNVLETGADLRGRRWPDLRELARAVRLVIVPLAQPDGRIRSAVRHLAGGSVDDLCYYGQGMMQDGQLLRWPECKRTQPAPLDRMRFLGGYYNDAGINVQHDDFFAPSVAPETRALLDLVREETPDCVVTLHSCGSGPFIAEPDSFIPQPYQYRQSYVAGLVRERHRREGLRPGGRAASGPTGGFYLHSAFHHTSGALPLLFEFPHGLQIKPFSFDEILDSGLLFFEELLRFGLNEGFRPPVR